MGLLGRLLGGRAPDPLGDGVWRRAHDRYLRATERVHSAAAGDPALTPAAARLAGLLPAVGDVCAAAQRAAPSAGLDVPGGDGGRWLDVHRALSQAAGLAAQAAEAAVTSRLAAAEGDDAAAASRAAAAQRATDRVQSLVDRAQSLLP